jgi:hypothetical protein
VLQQTIGKATRALPHVQAIQALDMQPDPFQCSFELEATAGNVARLGVVKQAQLGRLRHVVTILADALPGVTLQPLDAIGYQALGLGTGAGELSLDEELVNAHGDFLGGRL